MNVFHYTVQFIGIVTFAFGVYLLNQGYVLWEEYRARNEDVMPVSPDGFMGMGFICLSIGVILIFFHFIKSLLRKK